MDSRFRGNDKLNYMNQELKQIKKIYFVGIKGVAMTALAIVAKEMGKEVRGSDVQEEFPTDATLHRFKIAHVKNFSPEHITDDIDLVVYTGAHQGVNNIEVQTAIKKGISVLPHGKALGLFMQGKKGISVAGSHGKTTTSAMIAHVLIQAGHDPSFAIGCGSITSLQTPAHAGSGDYFVAEADEYVTDPTTDQTPRFLWQRPSVLVITNIDFDHPDVYADLEAVKEAFADFTKQIRPGGFVVINVDDAASTSLLRRIEAKKITFGKTATADFQLIRVNFTGGRTNFQVQINGQNESFALSVPGEHNALNAVAAIAVLLTLRLTIEQIRGGLASFVGTERRFEKISEKGGKLLYDDYAHHPAEISATLAGARVWFPKRRIIAIFQPHTYSRTQALLKEFAASFGAADVVLLTEIYASAREKPILGISGRTLFNVTQKQKPSSVFTPEKADVLQYLKQNSRPNDLILTMGAGNIFTWVPDILRII